MGAQTGKEPKFLKDKLYARHLRLTTPGLIGANNHLATVSCRYIYILWKLSSPYLFDHTSSSRRRA